VSSANEVKMLKNEVSGREVLVRRKSSRANSGKSNQDGNKLLKLKQIGVKPLDNYQ